MILAIRPPTCPLPVWMSVVGEQCVGFVKLVLGLPICTIRLARGTIAREMRKEIAIGLAIAWTCVALVAIGCFVFPPVAASTSYTVTFAACASAYVMVLVGIPIYSRVTWGFYDGP
jgi:hypothetical protein